MRGRTATLLAFVLSWLAFSAFARLEAGKSAGTSAGTKETSAAEQVTVPLGETASEFTFSTNGALTYRGKGFKPPVEVKPDDVHAFRIYPRKDKGLAGAIAEDADGQNRAYLLDLGALVSIPLQKPGMWSAAQNIYWSPSGRYMLTHCAYEGHRFISIDLRTKDVVEGDFLGPKGKLWMITDEPHWATGADALNFMVVETCNPYDEPNCDSERVLAKYSVSLDPADLKATSKKVK